MGHGVGCGAGFSLGQCSKGHINLLANFVYNYRSEAEGIWAPAVEGGRPPAARRPKAVRRPPKAAGQAAEGGRPSEPKKSKFATWHVKVSSEAIVTGNYGVNSEGTGVD